MATRGTPATRKVWLAAERTRVMACLRDARLPHSVVQRVADALERHLARPTPPPPKPKRPRGRPRRKLADGDYALVLRALRRGRPVRAIGRRLHIPAATLARIVVRDHLRALAWLAAQAKSFKLARIARALCRHEEPLMRVALKTNGIDLDALEASEYIGRPPPWLAALR